MALIVNGVVRYAIHQVIEGNQVVNIWDTRLDTTGVITNRDDAVQDHAGDIIGSWVDNILPRQVDDLQLTSVSWVDLNSPDGTTGSRSSTDTITLPENGGSVDTPLPSNASVFVTKQIIGARDRRNGRLYQAGATEMQTSDANGNVLSAASLAASQTAFDALLDELDGTFTVGGLNYDCHPCVVHVTARDEDGHPIAGESTDIEALVVDDLLATQRRRLRR